MTTGSTSIRVTRGSWEILSLTVCTVEGSPWNARDFQTVAQVARMCAVPAAHIVGCRSGTGDAPKNQRRSRECSRTWSVSAARRRAPATPSVTGGSEPPPTLSAAKPRCHLKAARGVRAPIVHSGNSATAERAAPVSRIDRRTASQQDDCRHNPLLHFRLRCRPTPLRQTTRCGRCLRSAGDPPDLHP